MGCPTTGLIEHERGTLTRHTAHQRAYHRSAARRIASERPPELPDKLYLYDLLHSTDNRRLGALPALWELQAEFDDDNFREEVLHDRLEEREPAYGQLLEAIRTYEAFARSLQDGFDVLKAEAAQSDSNGFFVHNIARDVEFKKCVKGLHIRFAAAQRALGEITVANVSLQYLFNRRFEMFADPMDPKVCARALCDHHEATQKGKSAEGKRPWFDRLDRDRIYIRHAYRESRRDIQTDRYVHDYRGQPIRRFYQDLS
jgi:hypothetical protein